MYVYIYPHLSDYSQVDMLFYGYKTVNFEQFPYNTMSCNLRGDQPERLTARVVRTAFPLSLLQVISEPRFCTGTAPSRCKVDGFVPRTQHVDFGTAVTCTSVETRGSEVNCVGGKLTFDERSVDRWGS